MSDATTPEQPRTAAGRALLEYADYISPHDLGDRILAIEAEARPAVASEGLLPEQIAHNIVDEFPHIPHAIRVPLEQEIAAAIEAQARPAGARSEGLRAALWDADATEVSADDGVTETLFVGTVAEVAERIRAALAAAPERAALDIRAKTASAALDWYETTHANGFEHDHHCVASKWVNHKQVETGKPCTCGWGPFQEAMAAYDAERQGEQ